MNHWKETAAVLSRIAEVTASGGRRGAALATVVHTAGSAYRRPGAKLLVLDSGETVGGVSGGCLEADVREVARMVIAGGQPILRRYDMTDDGDSPNTLGLGCHGIVDIFVQPGTTGPLAASIGTLQCLLAGDAPVAVATVVGDARITDTHGHASAGDMMAAVLSPTGPLPSSIVGTLGDADLDAALIASFHELSASPRSAVRVVGDRRVFVDFWRPPAHLIVCGAGSDARPLVAYAADSGFRVTLLDHREALVRSGDFPSANRIARARPDDASIPVPLSRQTLAVVMTHSLAHDRAWVRRFLDAGLPYIGVLGPRERTERILSEIGADTTWPGCRTRVFGPVGLDLGADGPQQIAISIVAELLAFVSDRQPRHLWQRDAPIHVA